MTKEEIKAYNKKYKDENKEKCAVQVKKYRAENLEELKAYQKKYFAENPRVSRYHRAKRHAMQKRQTPPWADMKLVKEIYLNCPEGYEVDHIHPLSKGGLHVHYNLQYLTIHENRVKHTKILY